jgi:formate dehydrogenase maturation protein FdhE
MREILSQRGFTEEEIPQLEQMEDFAEVRKRVEQAQAETLLAELETRSNARTETASEETDARIEADTRTLEERWTAFKTDVLAITKTPESETPPETLEDMRTRLETEAIERVDENIRSRVASIPVI